MEYIYIYVCIHMDVKESIKNNCVYLNSNNST